MSLGRHKRRWEVDVKTEIKIVGYESVDWVLFVEKYGPAVGFYEQGNETFGFRKIPGIYWLAE
jgi:hypothetical protein